MTEDQEFQKHHLPQACMYCSNMAGYAPLDELERYKMGVYFCHSCNAEYLFYPDGTRASISLYTQVNNKTYRWSMVADGSAMLWWIKEPGIPGKQVNQGLVPVKGFDPNRGDIVPKLDPTNIAEKISLWLPFL